MRVGLMLPPSLEAAEVPGWAVWAEERGFDLLGAGEHVLFDSPTANAFVALAGAAAVTSRIRLVSAVTLLPLYPAFLAAKMASTLDRLSGGRFELGVGVGGENPVEFAAVGVPTAERGRRTDAALDVLARLFAGATVDVDGDPARLDPLPVQQPRPPLWVGGRSEASMRRAGRVGDVWMPYLVSPDRLSRGLAVARAGAGRAGRDGHAVTGGYLAWLGVDPDPARARADALTAMARTYGQDMDRIAAATIPTGTPEQVADRLAAYAAAGAGHLLLAPACATEDFGAVAELLADEVLPRLR